MNDDLILENSMPFDSQPIVVSPQRHALDQAILDLPPPGLLANFRWQFNESSRKLLHLRLLIALTSMLCVLLTLKIVGMVFAGTTFNEFLLRMSTAVVLVGVGAVLYQTPQASIRKLRVLESVGAFAVVVDVVWVLVAETRGAIATGGLESLPATFITISFAVSIFIAIYGMFIPSDWRRTAIITCSFALIPAITVIVLRLFNPSLQHLEGFPGFTAPVLTMVMAIAATQATRVVNQMRLEVETAKLYGQYQLLEKIGQGGRGTVYKAKHRLLKRPAAIKLIRSEIASESTAIASFEHEVQLYAQLTHWNSVQIYDYGQTDNGDFYYVMEYLEGETLLERIRRLGKLTNEETVNFIGQVCDGLQEAHLKGMVHRDIKPENIFLANNMGQPNVVKILDFGLAALKSETDRLHMVSGSPSYMSPEQINAKTLDERSDIYALGCVIYECLSGQCLFIGDSINDLFAQHLHQEPSLEGLPESARAFRDIIFECIEKDPRSRFMNVATLKQMLRSCV
ncbi:serine/threonine protein kinase [Aureliella helgolandensis]|nr:serine/threonine-protein kinase [Aureliella helgolandensis]